MESLGSNLDRLMDLIRHQRNELHDANLIDDREFAELAADDQAKTRVARLETYDELRSRLNELMTRYAFLENQRLCVGYQGGCDGNLVAIEHDEGCPAREGDLKLRPHLYKV